MNIYDSYSNNNGHFKIVRDTTICYIAGNGLTLITLPSDHNQEVLQTSKRYISSNRHGFQCYTTNTYKGIIAVVDYGLNPDLHIYQYPDLNLVQTIKNISELEVNQLEFSQDGKRLLVCTGVPSNEITIWDIEKGKPLEGSESKLEIKEDFINAEFSPEDENVFAILYPKAIEVCEIKPIFEDKKELSYRITVETLSNIDIREQQAKDEKIKYFKTFKWDNFNNIYLALGFDIYYLDKNLKIIKHPNNPIQSEREVEQLILTQKHVIVIHTFVEWFLKYDPSRLDEEDQQPFKKDKKFDAQIEENLNIEFMTYNYTYQHLYVINQGGQILIFDKQAESNLLEDDEEGAEKPENSDQDSDGSNMTEMQMFGFEENYHTEQIIFLKEIQNSKLLSISTDGRIFIRDLKQKKIVSKTNLQCQITSAIVTKDHTVAIIGSQGGVLRFLDISNCSDMETGISLKHYIRLFQDKPITYLEFNQQQSLLAVSSTNSKKIFFLQGNDQFKIVNFVKMPIQINNLIWNNNTVVVLAQFLLLSFQQSDFKPRDYRELELKPDIYYRKIDPDLNQICIINNEVYATGDERIIRKYKLPDDNIVKLAQERNKYPLPPVDELQGNLLKSNIIKEYNGSLVIGSQDGGLSFLNPNDQQQKMYKCQNLKFNGVSAFDVSYQYNIIYTGGFDGSIFIWQNNDYLEGQNFNQAEIEEFEPNSDLNQYLLDQQQQNDIQDPEVDFYIQVLQQQYEEMHYESIKKKKDEIKEGLFEIKEQLKNLIQENEEREEIERLTNDEFCIDIEQRDKIQQEGKQKVLEIKQKANRENLRTQLLRQLIKEQTWDTMNEQLKGINSLNSNIIVFNYHIRQRSEEELKKLQIIKNFRKIELQWKKLQQENKVEDLINLTNLQQVKDSYTVNPIAGKQQMVLVDYQKKAEEEQKEDEKQKSTKTGAGGQPGQLGLRQKKELEQKKKDEEKAAAEKKEQENKEQAQQNEKEEFTDWDFLYGALELFTNNRMINQIVLLQNIIFLIKTDFNSQFKKLMEFRQSQVEAIIDKNKRIEEILLGLHKGVTLFKQKDNIMQDPERVLTVAHEEIGFERYLTREEKQQLEQERLKEEERLRLLAQDDAGVRAIKQMMSGTLEEKKENPLDEVIIKEDWMDKPVEELNEDQRFRLKEYEVAKQKQEDEKEKIRKNLENELKKVRSEISDICSRFDERLLYTLKAKLEYDYRILEQELYIVRLSLAIIGYKNNNIELSECILYIKELQEKQQQIKIMREKLEIFDKKIQDNINSKDSENKNFFKNKLGSEVAKDLSVLWDELFDVKKGAEKRKKRNQIEDTQTNDQLIELDYLVNIKRNNIKKEQESNIFVHEINDIIPKFQNLVVTDADQYVELIKEKFQIQTLVQKYKQQQDDLKQSEEHYIEQLKKLETMEEEYNKEQLRLQDQIKEYQSCKEIIIRFKQGFVELSQDKDKDLDDAILISRKLIEDKNTQIEEQGRLKINLMEEIKDIKFNVAQAEYDLKKKELNIKKTQCAIKEVQLLKVKKEMQNALTKKDMKLNETAKKRLEEQIEKLQSTTDKKISIYTQKEQKIDETIDFIIKENDQLDVQKNKLEANVNQTITISDMKFKKNNDKEKEQEQQSQLDNKKSKSKFDLKKDGEADEKFKKIAQNRKLFEDAKRQTEEIELLREELNKLKAKTFANFTNVQR